MTKKPFRRGIETTYAGHTFRSRLDARHRRVRWMPTRPEVR
jgi:hypothetical protein